MHSQSVTIYIPRNQTLSMELKERKLPASFQGSPGYEIMKEDGERIMRLVPGFQPPMPVRHPEELVSAPHGMELKEPVLSLPMKKEKREL